MDITVRELRELKEGSYILLDIRKESERKLGEIPGSLVCSEDDISEVSKGYADRKLIVFCHQGIESRELTDMLRENGYDAYNLQGGYLAYLVEEIEDNELAVINDKATRSIHDRFKKTLWSAFIKAVKTYRLVNEGDSIGVCISGGKDSMLMAKLFSEYHKYSDVHFDVHYIVMDPGYAPENRSLIESNARKLGIPVEIFESSIFDSVLHVEKSPCYLCARMRRGHLYSYAKSLGCNKISLGHHYDDVIETTLMGMLYGGQIQSMMPKLHSTNFEGMELIRPLYYIREDTIKAWRDYNDLHFLQCACKFTNTCSLENDNETGSKRVEIKNLIRELKKTNPYIEQNIFKSMENVSLDTVLAYKSKGVRHSFLENY